MSPEQACGKETDHRTDIWSFGCMIYQMLTGRLPFEGETSTDILARIIEREPDWGLLPQETPNNIRTLLRRCLEKEPGRRLENIAEASVEISNTLTKPIAPSVETIPANSRKMTMFMSVIIVIVLTGAAIWFGLSRNTESSAEVIRLVVLPFENLGSANDEDYSSAISAEIISRLVGIHGLAVSSGDIAENRAMLMGKKFGVDYILKGTVQSVQLSDPNRWVMRIRPQLIRISDGQIVWAEPYDQDMSQIHRIPSELAEQVVQALNLTLPETENQILTSEPTEQPDAYLWYLRGNDYFHRSYLESDLIIAIRMYQNAVKCDPNFASAFAQLSRAHAHMYWFHGYSKEHLSKAKQAVERAFQLNPELPEIRLALGHYYYHGLRDYEQAIEQFTVAKQSMSNSSELLSLISAVQRRQGKLRQALATYKNAYEIDPFSNKLAIEIANTHTVLREYPEAERFYTRGISLAPDVPMPYHRKALLYLFWEGRTENAWAILEEALQNANSAEEEPRIVYLLVMLNVYDGNYQEALTQLSSWSEESFDIQRHYIPKALLCAMIYGFMGNRQLEQTYFESARKILETRVREDPNDRRFHSSLGIAYAGLGQKENAIIEGKKGSRTDLAHIYVMVGEYDAAIDQLEILLSRPGEMSLPLLQLEPAWEPLGDHPRFQKLLASGK
jgi:serine/threonine-protein kinase